MTVVAMEFQWMVQVAVELQLELIAMEWDLLLWNSCWMGLVAMNVVAMEFLLNGLPTNGIKMNGTNCNGILVEWYLLLWDYYWMVVVAMGLLLSRTCCYGGTRNVRDTQALWLDLICDALSSCVRWIVFKWSLFMLVLFCTWWKWWKIINKHTWSNGHCFIIK